jgi:hypothetical protein
VGSICGYLVSGNFALEQFLPAPVNALAAPPTSQQKDKNKGG